MKAGEGSDESEESLDIMLEPDARPLLKAGAPKITRYVILLCSISTIGGFLFGYDTGVVSGALVELKVSMPLSSLCDYVTIFCHLECH